MTITSIKPEGDTPRNVALRVNHLIRLTAGFTTTEPHATGFTLTEANTGGSFSNDDATGLVTFQLPPVQANLEYTFIVTDADGIAVDAFGTNTIRVGTAFSSPGGVVSSTQVGSVLTLKGANDTGWVGTNIIGVWDVSGTVTAGENVGASGTFTTTDLKTVTVVNGIITAIV